MRNVAYTEALKAVRTIKARMTFRDTLLRFSALPTSESIVETCEDSEMVNGGLLRVLVSSGNQVYFGYYPEANADFLNGVVTAAGISIYPLSRIGLHQNRLFYQWTNGVIYYADYANGVFGSPVSTGLTYAVPVTPAPVSLTEFYAVTVNDNASAYAMKEVHYHDINGADVAWEGRVYGKTCTLNIADAVRLNGVDYIYLLDNTEKRTLYLKKVGSLWSELKMVVPMDVVDDMSLFRMSSATIINGRVFVTGVLKRTYGVSMHVYLIGPEEFTFGRDLFIRPENVEATTGKLHLFGDYLWYVGHTLRFRSLPTMTVGVDNPSLKAVTEDILAANVNCAASNAFSLSSQIKNTLTHPALKAGAEVDFEVSVNNEYHKLGTFGIDALPRSNYNQEKSLQLNAKSIALKRLGQWESDASYDYWSQTKVSTKPAEYDEVVRTAGDWDEYGEGLYLKNLNEDGFLYTTAKTATNGLMRARFTRQSGDFKVRFGVGLNYYMESTYDASVRLGIKMEEVKDDQHGHNGIFAIYGDTEHFGTEGIGLYLLDDSEWIRITSVPYNITFDVPYWLMIQFIDGRIRVFIRADASTEWVSVLAYTFESYDVLPWKHENSGHGAIFCNNITPHNTAYELASDAEIIGVHDNSMFPAADEVIIDSERMTYNGKSKNELVGPLENTYGKICQSYEVIGSLPLEFGISRADRTYAVQRFTLSANAYLNAVSVYAKKIGYPEDDLTVDIWRGPRTSTYPLGQRIGSASISADNVPVNGGWVTAKFNGLEIHSGDYLVLRRSNSPAINQDYVNHYATFVGGLPTYTGGQTETFSEEKDIFTTQTGDIPFRLFDNGEPYGKSCVVHVKTIPALSSEANYYNNMGLVVTEGTGKGTFFTISGYEHGPDVCKFYVDRQPRNIIDDTSILMVVPTLLNVKRAQNDTLAASHSADTIHIYRDRPFVVVDLAQFYSSEEDICLEEMTRKIARKAGILETVGASLYPETIIPALANPVIDRRNLTVLLNLPSLTGTVVLSGRRYAENSDGVNLVITSDHLDYCFGSTLRERFALDHPLLGETKVTYFDRHLSIWCCGKFIYSFTIRDEDYAVNGPYFTITGTENASIPVYIPEASLRIDNYILDAGQKGQSLLDNLINNKRFWYQDDKDGRLRIYQARQNVNDIHTPYALAVTGELSDTDTNLITRLRLEGTDINENFDTEMMVNYGNIFHMQNVDEINSEIDAQYYTDIILLEYGSRVGSRTLVGAADPRIEPNDMVYVNIAGDVKRIIVDNINYILQITEEEIGYDMQISGRIPREDMV